MDGLCVPDLTRAQVAVVVLGKQVREEQHAIQRSPKLVRHVRKELRLVRAWSALRPSLEFEDALARALHSAVGAIGAGVPVPRWCSAALPVGRAAPCCASEARALAARVSRPVPAFRRGMRAAP